jgi:hypothetical protein
MKKTTKQKTPLFAHIGDLSRPVQVRPVRYLGLDWWAISADDTWPGIVMDLRRLGFEATAMGDEVLVREPDAMYEPMMEGPNAPGGLRPFPTLHPTIQIRKSAAMPGISYGEMEYLDEEDEDAVDEEEKSAWESEDLDDEA